MKRIISLCILIAAMLPIMAQSSQVKKAAKNIFKLTTFNAEGKLLSTSYGILVDADGTALSSWNPFVGASSANIIDAQGRKYDVDCLIGANEIYNVSKFRVVVPNEKKMQIAPVNITSETVPVGGECWMVEYGMKNPAIKRFSPSIVETFADNLPYYTFEQTASDDLAGSPFLNASGELMGLMQPATKRTDLYCPSAQYAMSMTVNALTANQATIRQTNIRVALPDTYDQALLALMMAQSRNNPDNLIAMGDEFIRLFPNAYEGYNAKASAYTDKGEYAQADVVMRECLEKSDKKEEAHFAFSRLIYNKVVFTADSSFTEWTLDKAMEEIKAAYDINPQPTFILHRAKIYFAQQDYDMAYKDFIDVTKTNMRSAECFYDAAQCQKNLKAEKETIIALLDSAVACFTEPYTADAAPFFLARAQYLDEAGLTRKAVNDLYTYEKIMQQRLSSGFYYMREQMELRCRLYQQAIDDIEKACLMAPQEATYLAEKAMLLVRVNKLDDALKTITECIRLFPDNGDAHSILGLTLIQMGKKKEGIAELEKAKGLNSEMAQPLLDKYGK